MDYYKRQDKKQQFLDLAQELLSEYRAEELVKFLVEELNFRFDEGFVLFYVNIEDDLFNVGDQVTIDDYQQYDQVNTYTANRKGVYRQKNGRPDCLVAVRHEFLEDI